MVESTTARPIASMAAKFGVSLRTLRFYEDRGLLSPSRRGTSRFYSAADEIKLELVLKGKRLGMSLREIETLILTTEARSNAAEGRLASPALALPIEVVEAKIRELETRYDDVVSTIEELRPHLDRDLSKVEPLKATG